jgi:hypothetical protein
LDGTMPRRAQSSTSTSRRARARLSRPPSSRRPRREDGALVKRRAPTVRRSGRPVRRVLMRGRLGRAGLMAAETGVNLPDRWQSHVCRSDRACPRHKVPGALSRHPAPNGSASQGLRDGIASRLRAEAQLGGRVSASGIGAARSTRARQ